MGGEGSACICGGGGGDDESGLEGEAYIYAWWGEAVMVGLLLTSSHFMTALKFVPEATKRAMKRGSAAAPGWGIKAVNR